MACATTRPTFSFHLSQLLPPQPRSHFHKLPMISLTKVRRAHFVLHSIDVSKEDKPPTSDQSNVPPSESPPEKPDDWRCSTCGAAQSFFESKRVEIAGFAQNQQYGLGGNALTSGQKAILIYGSLLFFVVLFLLGYFLVTPWLKLLREHKNSSMTPNPRAKVTSMRQNQKKDILGSCNLHESLGNSNELRFTPAKINNPTQQILLSDLPIILRDFTRTCLSYSLLECINR